MINKFELLDFYKIISEKIGFSNIYIINKYAFNIYWVLFDKNYKIKFINVFLIYIL